MASDVMFHVVTGGVVYLACGLYVGHFTKYSDELEPAAIPASVTLVSAAAMPIIQPTVCPSAVNSAPDPTTAFYLPVASSW